jgi:poly-beta-1,6-N-acetyl-D-glucosamine synthase
MLLHLGVILLIIAFFPYIVYLFGITLGKRSEETSPLGEYPHISIIISAYNEASVIGQRIANLAQSRYPRDRYEVIFVDDLSSDTTKEIAERSFEEHGIIHRIIQNTERLGTSRSYNKAIQMAHNDIVITTDADVFFERDALSLVVSRLVSDERIVAVCGDLQPLPDSTSTRAMESVYRDYYGRMCDWESAIDSCCSFNGALVAFKRSCIQRIDDRKGADDANTAFEAIRSGRRAVYEIRAVVFEDIPADVRRQYRQKVRRATGLIEATLSNLDLLREGRPFTRFFYPLRIGMYIVTPAAFFLGVLLISLGLLLIHPLIVILLISLFALLSLIWRKNLITAFALNQAYLLIGLLHLGRDVRVWESTSKKSPGA